MKRMIGIVLIIVGILTVGAGVFLIYKKSLPEISAVKVQSNRTPGDEESHERKNVLANEQSGHKVESTGLRTVDVEQNARQDAADQERNRKAGLDFEKYVVLKFDKNQYVIKNWAGDKFINGRYAETTVQPDLTLELKYEGKRYPFAVECKWRSKPKSEFIKFSEQAQLRRYQQFATQNDMPTFIVLGVGGTPEAPEDVFVFPVDRFSKPVQHLDNLEQFKRETHGALYFNFKHKFLK